MLSINSVCVIHTVYLFKKRGEEKKNRISNLSFIHIYRLLNFVSTKPSVIRSGLCKKIVHETALGCVHHAKYKKEKRKRGNCLSYKIAYHSEFGTYGSAREGADLREGAKRPRTAEQHSSPHAGCCRSFERTRNRRRSPPYRSARRTGTP